MEPPRGGFPPGPCFSDQDYLVWGKTLDEAETSAWPARGQMDAGHFRTFARQTCFLPVNPIPHRGLEARPGDVLPYHRAFT
jgi:hypothetical protein